MIPLYNEISLPREEKMNQPARAFVRSTYRQEFRPRSLPASLVTGSILGLMEVFFAMSFASLIFKGSLEADLPRGMGLALISSAVILISTGLASSQPGIFAVVQDVPAVLLAVIAAQIVPSLDPAAALPTILVLIACTSLLAGGALVLIGQLKLSGLIRYMPYPVVGGFIAATGWLLVTGSIPIMTGVPLDAKSLAVMMRPDQLVFWLPGIAIAAAIFLVIRFARHPLALPGVLAGSLAIYHLVRALAGVSLAQGAAMGLFSGSEMSVFWAPLAPANFLAADWGALLRQGGSIAVLVGMTLVGLLLNISALEVVTGREFDLNHEMRSAGLSNLLAGLAGGYIGYHMVGNTSIAMRVGLRDRLTPIFGGLTCLVLLLFQPPLLDVIPKALFAGALLAMGLDFLYEWVIVGWNRFSRAEYAGVLLILVVIALTNYLTGVVVGLLAMVVLFAVMYSRVRVILRSYCVGEIFSTVDRPAADNQALEKRGGQALVYELQGFLFFGTANVLLDALKQRLAEAGAPKLSLLLVDFHAVTGIDSSAALSFAKTVQLADDRCIRLVLTGASSQVQARLDLERLCACHTNVRVLADLDHGLEWCEEQVLAETQHPRNGVELASEEGFSSSPAPGRGPGDLVAQRGTPSMGGEADPRIAALTLAGLSPSMAIRAAAYMTGCELGAGEILIRKGDPACELYFLASGQVSIYQETETGLTRLRTMGPGSMIGEMALYLSQPRTANVTVDRPSRLLRLGNDNLEQISREDPALFAALHQLIGHQLAMRVRKDEQGLKVFRR